MKRLIIKVKYQKILRIIVQEKNKVIDDTHLTVGQGLDIMLIRALDKILCKNKIEKLSFKNVEISGKIEPNALSGMMLQTVAKALII